MRKRKITLGLFFSAIFIYLFLWKPQLGPMFRGEASLFAGIFGAPRIDFNHLRVIVGEVQVWPLVVCFLLSPLHVLIRSHRWSLMVKPMGQLKTRDSFSLQMVGYLANTILPLRIGEVVRGVLLGQRMGVSTSSGLGAVLIERMVDMVSMMFIIMTVSLLFPFPRQVADGAFALGVISAFGMALALYLGLVDDPFGGKMGRLIGEGKTGKVIREQGEKFAVTFQSLRRTEHFLVIVVETAMLWAIYATQGWMVMKAFHFMRDYPLIADGPFLAVMVVLVLNSVGVSLPSAPGSVGTFHAISVFGLSLFDVPPDPAAGFALVIHALTIFFYFAGGLPLMWREGLHLSELRKLAPNGVKGSKKGSSRGNA